MTHAREDPTSRSSLILAAALTCVATSAGARTYVVDPSGNGNFTTIQAALNAVAVGGTPDSVVVHAGHYAEHLVYPVITTPLQVTVIAPSGPDSTTALDFIDTLPVSSYGWWYTSGFGYEQLCRTRGVYEQGRWERCKFFGGFEGDRGCAWPDLQDCDFYARSKLLGYYSRSSSFANLRFHHAPLTASRGCGDLRFYGCTFEGSPGDTLVQLPGIEDMILGGCTFDTGAIGLLVASGNNFTPLYLGGCTFRHLDQAIVDNGGAGHGSGASIGGNRYEHCGRAVNWPISPISDYGDVLSDCGDRAVVVGGQCSITNMVADGVAGTVIDYAGTSYPPAPFTVTGSSFRNVDGTALRVREWGNATGALGVVLTKNRFERCGAGADIVAGTVNVTHDVAFDCDAGDGIAVTLTDAMGSDSLAYNTSVSNRGHGITVVAGLGGMPAALVVSRNLVAMNNGDGIRIGAGFAGTAASNDSWQNYGAEYSGVVPDTTNLQLDPRFCGLLAGDLTLSAGSPGSEYTSTGPMGALGVGCDVDLLGVPSSPAASVFGVRPSPARGSVEFTLPARALEGSVEVLDAQGRRVWGTPVAAGVNAVRWRGERERGGTASGGVYWARMTRAGETRARRFVWLR